MELREAVGGVLKLRWHVLGQEFRNAIDALEAAYEAGDPEPVDEDSEPKPTHDMRIADLEIGLSMAEEAIRCLVAEMGCVGKKVLEFLPERRLGRRVITAAMCRKMDCPFEPWK